MAYAKARAFLAAVAQGEAPDPLAEELAAAVLDDDLVRLALAVAAEGEHRWRRAIELAGALVAAEHAESAAEETGPGRAPGSAPRR
ncbi:MAG: hypothetical protein HY909_09615 [Deltaproteobacteria bacterium]|nr:hypothetical protein [Deltaproteobacteria bacterium]